MKKVAKRYAFVKLNAEEIKALQHARAILRKLDKFINDNEHQVQADEELEELIDDIYYLSEDIDFVDKGGRSLCYM